VTDNPPPVWPLPTSARLAQVAFKGRRIDLCLLPDEPIDEGTTVVVEADRGVDLGTLIRNDPGRLETHPKNPPRQILRRATEDEIRHIARLREEDAEALRICRECVEMTDLPMRVIDAEFQFDGNRVTFYFVAEGRIDFRALVRDLAKIFRTRIELRQIHPREAARRQGGLGPCGRGLCCAGFLQAFEPVTLKMAKRQNLALTPARISGLCGRLLCCLSYGDGEDEPPCDGACGAGGCAAEEVDE
jgi:cell fate regulator YaaT (PSP1 superfamily)